MARPLKYRSATQLERHISKYFAERDREKKPYTITGLAIHLGIDRKTLKNYADREMFVPVIKAAQARIEDYVEQQLITGRNQAGCIFWLKNHDWTDKTEIDVNDITQLTKDDLVKKLERMQARPIAMRKRAVNDSINSDGSE